MIIKYIDSGSGGRQHALLLLSSLTNTHLHSLYLSRILTSLYEHFKQMDSKVLPVLIWLRRESVCVSIVVTASCESRNEGSERILMAEKRMRNVISVSILLPLKYTADEPFRVY